MGFRDGLKKGGGGLLNNVDVELQSGEFTRRFKGETKDGSNLYFVPQFLVDGADEAIDQHIFVGKGDRYAISDDGQDLTMEDGSPVSFPYSMPFGKLIDSLDEAFKKVKVDINDELPDIGAGEPLNLSALYGRRFRVKQAVDHEANNNPRIGKRKVSKMVNGKKVEKEYDRTYTVIDAVLGTEAAAATGKASGKVGSATGDAAIEARAGEVLKAVLEDAPVLRKNLSLPVTKALLKEKQKNQPFAEAVKAKVLDEDWQGEQEWLDVDRKGNLSVAA